MKNEMNKIPTPETNAEWQSACCSGKNWYRIAERINEHSMNLERRLTLDREALESIIDSCTNIEHAERMADRALKLTESKP